ncbi:MAG: MBL fold metallo-hydrolase [Spirochaetes bacterium]|nr:MBL fold metallo-hydrolase [Spirochaetota bacterium]
MKTKLTVLCENSVYVPFPLIGEHGFSCLIEGEDATLFDTGQGLGIMNNMKVLGKDPSAIRRIILSHGHYDHTGGLLHVLKSRDGKTEVHLHPSGFKAKVAHIPTGGDPIEVPIGMRATRDEYEAAGAEFINISGYQPITGGIHALSEVKRPKGWTTWDTRLKQKEGDKAISDPFDDDVSLLIETDSGPVVLLGCAHAGIVEILNDLAERSGHKEFHAVIGGTHLETAPEEYVKKAMETLRAYKVKKIAVSHCTGFARAAQFATEFPESFATASTGAVFEF